MAVKVTKAGVALCVYEKIGVTRSNVCVENFTLVSKSAQGWYYATLQGHERTIVKGVLILRITTQVLKVLIC